jgi:phosphoribosylanthranilate isomerase
MMVKICGITRREDAEAAVEAGASAIGFVFAAFSPRYIAPERAAEIGRDLDVWKVGVFVEETAASVEAVAGAASLDVVQLYGGETPSTPRVWRAFRVRQVANLRPDGIRPTEAEAILLDGPAAGVAFDWTQAPKSATKLILAGGLDASNVAEAIRVARPWGVDASSRLEIAPGIKDHQKVRQFILAAREAAA